MKFGKEFDSQMVQEWQEAYMDYNNLKSILKDIQRFKIQNVPTPMASTPKGSLKRKLSLYRAFSGLTGHQRRSPRKMEDEVILIHAEDKEVSQEFYQTMFLKSAEDGGEKELVFFRRLDDEFNKVNNFYQNKVKEVMEEALELSKQMEALIALRIKVDKVVGFNRDEVRIVARDQSLASASMEHHMDDRRSGQHHSHMDVIQEVDMLEVESGKYMEATSSNVHIQGFRPAPLGILDHVKINVNTPETPVSTVKGLLISSKTDLSFSKAELRKAEEQMSKAFIEFYQKLRLLKRYSFLNLLAFSKIMKKYDKITSRNASKDYLRMVDNSYVGCSDEVSKIVGRVEATFVKHFANGNQREGMKQLKPMAKRGKHRITFFLGFFTGCIIALMVALIILIHARNILQSKGHARYMENIFPLYSLLGYIILHMLMYSANVYFWKRFRINYSFIFGLKQGTELDYREVFLLSSGLAVLTLAAVLSNLDMEMDQRTKSFPAFTELIPLGLVIVGLLKIVFFSNLGKITPWNTLRFLSRVVLLITFCPFKMIYKSSRFFLVQCAIHCICAPLYKVTLADHFFADQLTSQVQALRSLEFYVCHYGWGDFKTRSNNCLRSETYKTFYLIVAIVPFWIRSVQAFIGASQARRIREAVREKLGFWCLRRLLEERDLMHGLNGLKHVTTVTALAMRTKNDLNRGLIWRILAAASSGVATIVNTFWDIAIDWGLLRRNSKNPWLRDKLSIQNRTVYYVAMVVNVLLRLAWMQSVLGIREAPFLHRTALTALVACLEILRRGIWNFFRLENEHFNNVGKYRAFKSVPLPFNYEDDDHGAS